MQLFVCLLFGFCLGVFVPLSVLDTYMHTFIYIHTHTYYVAITKGNTVLGGYNPKMRTAEYEVFVCLCFGVFVPLFVLHTYVDTHTYICIYVWCLQQSIEVFVCLWFGVLIPLFVLHTYVDTHTYICMYGAYSRVLKCSCVCCLVCVFACLYRYLFYIPGYTHVYIYVCVCVYIYIYVYVYIYISYHIVSYRIISYHIA
jgi:hypothetical protein